MGAFAEMFPGRKLGQEARDEDSTGEGDGPRLLDGPLDLDTGVVRVVPPREAAGRAEKPQDAPGPGH